MLGLKVYFLNIQKQVQEGQIVDFGVRGATVFHENKHKFIPVKSLLWIPEFPEQDYDKHKPCYSYKSEEFLVLWDNERYVEDNLCDIFRYYQRCTLKSKFIEEYWRLLLSELEGEISREEMVNAWLKAKKKESQINPVKVDISPYQKGQQVYFDLHGIRIVFTNHAIERTFERSNVHFANLRSLLWQMLQDSIPVKTPKQEQKPGSVFLYNNDFNWTFALIPNNKMKESYVVVTCFEPSIHWRKKEIDLTTPFFEE